MYLYIKDEYFRIVFGHWFDREGGDGLWTPCDILTKDMDADIKTDILDWDYKAYDQGYFDLIWASPPCTE